MLKFDMRMDAYESIWIRMKWSSATGSCGQTYKRSTATGHNQEFHMLQSIQWLHRPVPSTDHCLHFTFFLRDAFLQPSLAFPCFYMSETFYSSSLVELV